MYLSRFIIFTLIALNLIACSKEKNTQSVLPSGIQAIIDNNQSCTCEPYINLYKWKNQEVYMEGAKGASCNWTPLYYNKNGEPMEMENGYTLIEFQADAELIKNVWTCQSGNH